MVQDSLSNTAILNDRDESSNKKERSLINVDLDRIDYCRKLAEESTTKPIEFELWRANLGHEPSDGISEGFSVKLLAEDKPPMNVIVAPTHLIFQEPYEGTFWEIALRNSPVTQALSGKSVGDEVCWKLPFGEVEVRLIAQCNWLGKKVST